LWAQDDSSAPISTLSGHNDRLSRVVFHGMGAHAITTSFDTSWRLWDIETSTSLLVQDGHARPVYGLAVHPDGSLVATGDLSGNGRVWDLRSGQVIRDLVGHIKQILSIDFSSNG
jgi:U4/U6 small nuclear ribonucleoprotein PRP4